MTDEPNALRPIQSYTSNRTPSPMNQSDVEGLREALAIAIYGDAKNWPFLDEFNLECFRASAEMVIAGLREQGFEIRALATPAPQGEREIISSADSRHDGNNYYSDHAPRTAPQPSPVPDVVERLQSRIKVLEGRIETLHQNLAMERALIDQQRKALEPFAQAAQMAAWPTFDDDRCLIDQTFGVTVGDLRRARALKAE